MNDSDIAKDLARPSTYFKDNPSFAIIVLTVSLMTATLVNTQAAMKQIAHHVLVFLGLDYLLELLPNQLGREK
jgi:cytochrome c biogenesis protein CcdA